VLLWDLMRRVLIRDFLSTVYALIITLGNYCFNLSLKGVIIRAGVII